MKALEHGANVVQMAMAYGKDPMDIIDFSSNINPYTVPDLEKHLEEALDLAVGYPDIAYNKLKRQIADYLKVDQAQVIPGNGATEIMYLLMKAFRGRLGILHPTFSEYERSAKLNGLETVDFYYEEGNAFELPMEAVKRQLDQIDALFICNPNNPTGDVKEIKELLDLLKASHKLLIVDETFMEFVDHEEKYSLVPYVADYENLIIIKAITKFFGLPGLRLGYGVSSNQSLLEQMMFYKEPWTINSFAEHLTGFMLKHEAYIAASKAYFIEERDFMLAALEQIETVKAYKTQANFILLKLKHKKAEWLKEVLFTKYDLLIRDASNFKGLDEQYVRVAIKTREENELLLAALKSECGKSL